jgi:hypothetical protein
MWFGLKKPSSKDRQLFPFKRVLRASNPHMLGLASVRTDRGRKPIESASPGAA